MPGFRSIFCPNGLVLGAGRVSFVSPVLRAALFAGAAVFFAAVFFVAVFFAAVFLATGFFAAAFFTADRLVGSWVVRAMRAFVARSFVLPLLRQGERHESLGLAQDAHPPDVRHASSPQWQLPRPWSRTPPSTGRNSQVYAPSSSVSFINPNVPAWRTSLFGSVGPKG